MKKVFIDTGAWYALKNKNDRDHLTVVNFFKALPSRGIICYTSDYVIDEAITLTRARLKNHQLAAALAEDLLSEKAAAIIYAAPHYLQCALKIYKKYKDQHFSFTDCTSFAIMNDLGIREALSFDSHYTFEAFGFQQLNL